VACGGTTTILRLYELISKELGVSIPPNFGPPRPGGDIMRSFADITRAKEGFGYTPRVSVEEGIKRTVAWYRAQHAKSA
jgi:nucleoside-diphosphate-sugar epimerase